MWDSGGVQQGGRRAKHCREGLERAQSRKKSVGGENPASSYSGMLRNPREGKVGEAVARFSLKFPQQCHIFTWLFHVQTQGHTPKQLILLWMHRRVANKPRRRSREGGIQLHEVCGELEFKTWSSPSHSPPGP